MRFSTIYNDPPRGRCLISSDQTSSCTELRKASFAGTICYLGANLLGKNALREGGGKWAVSAL
jgi:hypothetical protein